MSKAIPLGWQLPLRFKVAPFIFFLLLLKLWFSERRLLISNCNCELADFLPQSDFKNFAARSINIGVCYSLLVQCPCY